MKPADLCFVVPSAITLFGHALGVYGIYLGVPEGLLFLVASLVCDGLDGFVARQLNAVTEIGAALDWFGDLTLAALMIWRVFPSWFGIGLSSVLAILVIIARKHVRRPVSGRIGTWGLLVTLVLFGVVT